MAIIEADEVAAGLLLDARRLIASGWCQDAEAETREGRAVAATSAAATRFSLQGALVAAWGALPRRDFAARAGFHLARQILAAEVGELSRWNDADGRTKEHVLALLDAAVEKLAGGSRPRQ